MTCASMQKYVFILIMTLNSLSLFSMAAALKPNVGKMATTVG